MTDFTTVSLHKLNLSAPALNLISIEDIAHSLSLICRFNGHIQQFYSVAEHCVLLSKLVPEEYAYAALLHDAAEAYTGDITRPLRELVDIRAIEDRFNDVIREKYRVAVRFDCDEILEADKRLLCTERPELAIPGVEPFPIKLNHWTPYQARSAFMLRFFELQ